MDTASLHITSYMSKNGVLESKRISSAGKKNVVRFLSFVSVMMGTNDLRQGTNSSDEDVYRVFAITDLVESTSQLLSVIIPFNRNFQTAFSSIANNKLSSRFNAFGQTVDLARNLAKNGGKLGSPEEAYWLMRAVTNTLSIASKTLGRVFLPLIAFDSHRFDSYGQTGYR